MTGSRVPGISVVGIRLSYDLDGLENAPMKWIVEAWLKALRCKTCRWRPGCGAGRNELPALPYQHMDNFGTRNRAW